jgi:Rad3-related DNA helicase
MFDGLKETSGLHISRPLYEIGKLAGVGGSDPRIPVDMLVCDECDAIEAGELGRFISIDISRRECLHLGLSWPDSGLTIEDWREWAEDNQDSVESRLAKLEGRLKVGGNDKSKGNGNGNGNDSNSPDTSKGWSRDLKSLRDMKRKLSRLSDIRANDDWVMQEKETDNDDSYTSSRTAIINLKSVQFSPLSPARYAESTLWRGVEKVVLMSATVRPKTLQLLGIRDDDMEFIEFPSTFDAKRRPVIVVPAGIQMNYRNEQNDLKMLWWLGRLDAILGARLDRKGIIHTHSYGRAKFIFDNSAHSRYMLIHNSRDRDRVIDEFKNSTSPLILVSPSVDTGYDFPMEQCEYQIIAKLPFQSTTDKLVKARQARDKDYGIFITSQNIIQMAGRGMRSEIDQCETIILDDSFSDWFYRRAKGYFPEWFIKSIVRADGIPEPLPRLGINVEK